MQIILLTMENIMTITQYARFKQVHVSNVYYWIKHGYLNVIKIAGKKFIDSNSNPIKKLK